MIFEVHVVLDSIAPNGVRLTTLAATYPRYIHVEALRHRVWARNAESSRAIPVKKRVARCMDDPVAPIEWGINKPGMAASEVLTPEDAEKAASYWHAARLACLDAARKLDDLKVHKQVANRVFESFVTITEVITASEWKNFEFLRKHPAADPNMQELARHIVAARDGSSPKELKVGEWHLPFIDDMDRSEVTNWLLHNMNVAGKRFPSASVFSTECLKQMSAARCARTSQLNHEGKRPSVDDDLKLFDRLVAREKPLEDPGHWSPLEHQATPIDVGFKKMDREWACDFCLTMQKPGVAVTKKQTQHSHGNSHDKNLCSLCSRGHCWSGPFKGWSQYRKEFPTENFDAL